MKRLAGIAALVLVIGCATTPEHWRPFRADHEELSAAELICRGERSRVGGTTFVQRDVYVGCMARLGWLEETDEKRD